MRLGVHHRELGELLDIRNAKRMLGHIEKVSFTQGQPRRNRQTEAKGSDRTTI